MIFTFWLTYAFVMIEITMQEYILLVKKKAGVKA